MKQTWPRGSEWRKWDLHLHAPGTKLSDQFSTEPGTELWDNYCQKLHDSDVQAFGIADYFSLDGYLAVRGAYQSRYADSPKVFFPNIELRTNDVVNRAQEEVNVHLLFNPFRSNYQEDITRFLGTLKTNKTGSLGKICRVAELKSADDYSSATTTRQYIQDALVETYGKDANLLEFLLIITAANNDGIRPERGKKRKLLITDELDKFSDAFFGNSGNVDYFLSTNRAEDGREIARAKPVLSGCDAHSFSDLDEKLGQVVSDASDGIVFEPTWVKADLNYEGLKQIVFEPRNRVFIGTEPEIERRVRENRTRYIQALHITSIDGCRPEQHGSWFHDEKIELGKELVAIIGNKGSGKSALTDVIGLLGNSHNQTSTNQSGQKPEELFSFLNRDKFLRGGCAKGYQGILHWQEGEPDLKMLDEKVASHLPQKVEYLPQKYLERICTNIVDGEFRATLNEVIFRYVKPQHRHGKGSLEELIQYRTQQVQDEIARMKHELRQANGAVVDIEKKLTEDYRKEIAEKIRLKKEEIAAHDKGKPEPKQNTEASFGALTDESLEAAQLTQRINALVVEIGNLETEQIELNTSVEELQQIRNSIALAVDGVIGLEAKHNRHLETIGVNFGQIVKLNVDYTVLDSAIQQKAQRIRQIETLLLTKDDIADLVGDEEGAGSVRMETSLFVQKEAIERQRAEIVERLSRPAREYQQYLNELKLWNDRDIELHGCEQNPLTETLKGLEDELKKVESVYRGSLIMARDDRERISREIFNKKRGVTQFYNEVKQPIDVEISKCRGYLGEYDITIEAGLRLAQSFFDDFLRFINQAAVGSFRGQEDGRAMLRSLTDTIENLQDECEVFAALNSVVEALHVDQREDLPTPLPARDVFKQIKGQNTPQDLYDYLFAFDYLEPNYDLKVDGKNLNELSPGERGGLLLIFYLMLDRQDIPLVIDQPEDNLDNKSVYEVLVKFIKLAKQRRQIILVTHNPNLAVVADAEQIIHVSIDKKDGKNDFDFFSGSIEEPRINQAVLDILEGTLPAFDNRRLKYRKWDRHEN